MLEDWIRELSSLAPEGTFFSYATFLKGFLAVVMVCLVCGAVGSMVVGNRMAFFSDALVHTAYAGVALGLIVALVENLPRDHPFFSQGVPAIMVGFGVTVGLAIAYVRERTGLPSDTVIGVFFAAAIGFASLFMSGMAQLNKNWSLEGFLFGDLLSVSAEDLLWLALLMAVTALLLVLFYNPMVFTSFNPSLARSRRLPLRLCNYLFIVLLALLINLCLRIVGAMLINGLLIVPAATAALLARNMRQLFWTTVALALIAGLGGLAIGWEVTNRLRFRVGVGAPIVALAVLLFFLAMAARPWLRGRQAAT